MICIGVRRTIGVVTTSGTSTILIVISTVMFITLHWCTFLEANSIWTIYSITPRKHLSAAKLIVAMSETQTFLVHITKNQVRKTKLRDQKARIQK